MIELSLCMIVRNEGANLKRCLDSVKSLVDEFVIVDTGSTDDTLSIAEAYKARIFNFEWINDFSAARNFALQNSKGKWILYLDADEILSPSSLLEVQRIMKTDAKEAYNCIVNSIDDYSGRPVLAKYPRLFRNDASLRFEGKVHEQINNSLKLLNYKFIDSPIEIIHYGYNVPEEIKRQKAKRNLSILLDEYELNKTGYNAFQLGQTYSILNEKLRASKYFNEAIKDENLNPRYIAFSYLFLANQEFQKHKYTEAYDIVQEALKYGITQPSINLLASKIAYKLNLIEEAKLFCKLAFEYNQNKKQAKDVTHLDIILSQEEIIYQGLFISFLAEDQDNLELFQKKLFTFWEEKNKSMCSTYIRIFRKLINNYQLDLNEQKKIADILNDYSIEFFLHLLNNYKITEIKINLYCELYPRFNKNGSFLNSFAVSLSATKKVAEAIKLLEAAIKLEEKEPASYFYLISLYLSNNMFDKIDELLTEADNQFSHIPEVKSRLNLLTSKLQPHLKNSKIPVNK